MPPYTLELEKANSLDLDPLIKNMSELVSPTVVPKMYQIDGQLTGNQYPSQICIHFCNSDKKY